VTALDDLETVLDLAALTEDRSDREQDAMLRVAAKIDAERNAPTVTNRRTGPASDLYSVVADSRDGEPRINAKTAARLRAQADRWNTPLETP
jgi:hypothetical protein